MRKKVKDRRLKDGCLICKLRHVKCDNVRPQCNNCRDSKRNCVGFDPLPATSTSAIVSSQNSQTLLRNISSKPQWTQKEIRSFSYGLHKTIPNLTIYFESDFWQKQIPRLAHNIPAIRHALNALASFHEKSKPGEMSVVTPGSQIIPLASTSVDKFFLQQYNKAIEGLSRHFTDSGLPHSVCILVCCTLFVCLEGLHGRRRAMVNHLQNGLKVFHEWVSKQDPTTRFTAGTIEASVYETFQRIDLHAAAFLEGHIPQSQQLTVIQQYPQLDMMNPVFVSIHQARSHLDGLYGQTFMFLNIFDSTNFKRVPIDKIPEEILKKHKLLIHVATVTAAALEKFHNQNETIFTTRELRSMTMLKIRIKIIRVFIMKWPYEAALHPEAEPEFQSIIELSNLMIREHLYGTPIPTSDSEHSGTSSDEASPLSERRTERSTTRKNTSRSSPATSATSTTTSTLSNFDEPPLFTLEVGLLPILYYIALCSTTTSIRAEALQLLKSANLREGLWSSNRAASMVEQQLMENHWQRLPVTGVEMSHLTKQLWTELQIEEENGVWA